MKNELTGNLLSEFKIIMSLMSPQDRQLFEFRVDRVVEDKTPGAYAVVQPRWTPRGFPRNCVMVLDRDAMRGLSFKDRLSVIAHEVAHVMTMRRSMGHDVREFEADTFARDVLGHGSVSGLRARWNNKRSGRRLLYDLVPDSRGGFIVNYR